MQLITELPEQPEEGSMWFAIRESGAVTQCVIVDGVPCHGVTALELDIHYVCEECTVYDPVLMYAPLLRPTDL